MCVCMKKRKCIFDPIQSQMRKEINASLVNHKISLSFFRKVYLLACGPDQLRPPLGVGDRNAADVLVEVEDEFQGVP